MSFEIIRYNNPYKLNEMSKWDELRSMPHLCISQAMVDGLKELYRKDFTSIVCTIEDILENLFKEWNSHEKEIEQYVGLTKIIDELDIKLDENTKKAFKFNKWEMIDSIRQLKELSIDSNIIDYEKLNGEQKEFLKVLNQIDKTKKELFTIEEKDIYDSFIDTAIKLKKYCSLMIEEEEIKDSQTIILDNLKKDLIMYDEFVLNLEKEYIVDKVIIHGVHQFTPIILRFIEMLKDNEIEVVFMYNYQENYPEIYKTWMNIYSCFENVTTTDEFNSEYSPISNKSFEIADSIGKLLSGERTTLNFKNIKFIEFDNYTEFANYVSNLYEGAGNQIQCMKEEFYSSNLKVNEILRAYYPDQYGERHFLSYPIGQFFLGIFKLWNEETEEIIYDYNFLRECLNSNIDLNKDNIDKLSVLNKLKVFLTGTNTLDEFYKRIDLIIDNRRKVRINKSSDLNYIGVYRDDVLSDEEIISLKKYVKSLNEIVKEIFDNDGYYYDFKKHYMEMIRFIETNVIPNTISKEEKKLMDKLLCKIESIKKVNISGSLDDLNDSMNYYLQQKLNNLSTNLIVKSFIHIEGNIIKTIRQKDDKIYHFACLSDEDMISRIEDMLPWPLNESFFNNACSNSNSNYLVYLKSLKEYRYFKRYALFYGLCFNHSNVILSYVKSDARKIMNPYYLLEMIGVVPSRIISELNESEYKNEIISTEKCENIKYYKFSDDEIKTFAMCHRKFFWEVLVKNSYYEDEFLIGRFCFTLILEKLWSELNELLIEEKEEYLYKVADKYSKCIKDYFEYMGKNTKIYDLKSEAILLYKKNYLYDENKRDQSYYFRLKKKFIWASVDDSESDLKSVVKRIDRSEYKDKFLEYMNNIKYNEYKLSSWCKVCNQRYLCLEVFRN